MQVWINTVPKTTKNSEKSPWPIGPRTLGPRTLSPWHLKSLGPWGQGPEVRGTLGPRPLSPWDLMCQGLKVRGPKVRGPMGQGLMTLESGLSKQYLNHTLFLLWHNGDAPGMNSTKNSVLETD